MQHVMTRKILFRFLLSAQKRDTFQLIMELKTVYRSFIEQCIKNLPFEITIPLGLEQESEEKLQCVNGREAFKKMDDNY